MPLEGLAWACGNGREVVSLPGGQSGPEPSAGPKKAHLQPPEFLVTAVQVPSLFFSPTLLLFPIQGSNFSFPRVIPAYALRPKCCRILRNGNMLPGSGLAPCSEHGDFFLPFLMTSKPSSPISPQCKPLQKSSSLLPPQLLGQCWEGGWRGPAAPQRSPEEPLGSTSASLCLDRPWNLEVI